MPSYKGFLPSKLHTLLSLCLQAANFLCYAGIMSLDDNRVHRLLLASLRKNWANPLKLYLAKFHKRQ